jgi:hypothetical protein
MDLIFAAISGTQAMEHMTDIGMTVNAPLNSVSYANKKEVYFNAFDVAII